MDLKQVALLLKQASEEIRSLKEENKTLKEKIANLEKNASVEEETGFISFGEVSEDPYSKITDNPIEKLKMYFS